MHQKVLECLISGNIERTSNIWDGTNTQMSWKYQILYSLKHALNIWDVVNTQNVLVIIINFLAALNTSDFLYQEIV